VICTICNRSGHVAASCPYRKPRFIDKVIAVAAMAFILCVHGWGHDAHLYDAECCHDSDCEPVQSVTYVAANSVSSPIMVVTTSLGTKPKTDKTIVRVSRDHRMHGCIHQDRLWCIYLPPGN
jgi:hypothetical protein